MKNSQEASRPSRSTRLQFLPISSPASTCAMRFAQNLAGVPGTRVTAVHTIDALEYSFGPRDISGTEEAAGLDAGPGNDGTVAAGRRFLELRQKHD